MLKSADLAVATATGTAIARLVYCAGQITAGCFTLARIAQLTVVQIVRLDQPSGIVAHLCGNVAWALGIATGTPTVSQDLCADKTTAESLILWRRRQQTAALLQLLLQLQPQQQLKPLHLLLICVAVLGEQSGVAVHPGTSVDYGRVTVTRTATVRQVLCAAGTTAESSTPWLALLLTAACHPSLAADCCVAP